MGKKKHKGKHGKHEHAEMRVDIPPAVAGLAAAAMQQVNTPAFRQLIAGALGAAAQAFDQRRAPPPTAPAPPVPPVSPPTPPHGWQSPLETPEITLPPEAAQAFERVAEQAGKAIETAASAAARSVEMAAAALERWAAQRTEGFARPDGTDERSPH